MGVRNPNSTNYEHPDEPNLLNLHKALEYKEDGKPALRVITSFDGNIIIEGDVNIPGTVTVNSTPEDPVHNHIVEVGTSGLLNVPYMPIGGTVELGTTTLAALENTTVTISGTPTVNIGTIPEIEIKNDVGNPISISRNTSTNTADNPIYVNANLTGSGDVSGIVSTIDSKGRLKVQTQETIFFNTFQFGKETDVWDESTACLLYTSDAADE